MRVLLKWYLSKKDSKRTAETYSPNNVAIVCLFRPHAHMPNEPPRHEKQTVPKKHTENGYSPAKNYYEWGVSHI